MIKRITMVAVLALGLGAVSNTANAQSIPQVVAPTTSTQSTSRQADTVREQTNDRLKEKSDKEKAERPDTGGDQKK